MRGKETEKKKEKGIIILKNKNFKNSNFKNNNNLSKDCLFVVLYTRTKKREK